MCPAEVQPAPPLPPGNSWRCPTDTSLPSWPPARPPPPSSARVLLSCPDLTCPLAPRVPPTFLLRAALEECPVLCLPVRLLLSFPQSLTWLGAGKRPSFLAKEATYRSAFCCLPSKQAPWSRELCLTLCSLHSAVQINKYTITVSIYRAYVFSTPGANRYYLRNRPSRFLKR